LGVDLEKLGHWKIKPNDYVFPICSERAIRGIYPEDLKDCKLEKSKTTNHLTRIWGKSKMKIELATIKQNQSGTRVPPANYPIEAALLL